MILSFVEEYDIELESTFRGKYIQYDFFFLQNSVYDAEYRRTGVDIGVKWLKLFYG